MKQSVTFFGQDGLRLAGDLYRPSEPPENGRCPSIVLCQGLSGIKEKVLPEVARAFASAGYVVLAFDYGGCGQSGDRRPRPYLFPLERAQDVFSALAYIGSLEGVDPESVGLYGISYGGGVAMYCAALEMSVRAAVFVSSPGGGEDFLASLRAEDEWLAFREELGRDRIRRAQGQKSRLVALEEVVPFPDSFWVKYRQLSSPDKSESLPPADAGESSPRLSLESAEAMARFRPDCFVPLLAPRPVLFIHGQMDDVALPEIIKKVYRRVPLPKEFVIFNGMDHIDLDQGPGLDRQIQLSIQWFDRHIKTNNDG